MKHVDIVQIFEEFNFRYLKFNFFVAGRLQIRGILEMIKEKNRGLKFKLFLSFYCGQKN